MLGSEGEKIKADFDKWAKAQPFDFAPFLMYKNAPFESEMLNIDSDGFRVNGLPDRSHRPFEYKIYTFGSSALFGCPVNKDKNTLSAQLESILESRFQNVNFTVRSFAVPHYTIIHDLIMLNKMLVDNPPNAIVFLNGYNDLYEMMYGGYEDSPMGGPQLEHLWELHKARRVVYWEMFLDKVGRSFEHTIQLYTKITWKFGDIKFRSVGHFGLMKQRYLEKAIAKSIDQKDWVSVGIPTYFSHYESMIQNAKYRDIEVISLFQPNIFVSNERGELERDEKIWAAHRSQLLFALNENELSELRLNDRSRLTLTNTWFDKETFFQSYRRMEKGVENLALKYDTIYFDVSKEFTKQTGAMVWADQAHYSDFGNTVIANRISEEFDNVIGQWARNATTLLNKEQ